MTKESFKSTFLTELRKFVATLTHFTSTKSGEWKVKGFIDVDKSIYTLSTDTKILSKLLEIQLFPLFKTFADSNDYDIVLAEKQN